MTQAGGELESLSIPELQAEIARLRQESRQIEIQFARNKQRLHSLDAELRRKQYDELKRKREETRLKRLQKRNLTDRTST